MVVQDKALELLASFSYITNKLNYCGPNGSYKELWKLLNDKDYNKDKVINHFEKYEGLYIYLKKIAEKNKKTPFDYEVIESYWLGNNLLDNFSKKDHLDIIDSLVKRGLPEMYAQRLKKKLPEKMNPHHTFNVLFVGVGMTSGSVPTNIVTMNNCIVSIGQVLEIKENKLIIEKNPLQIRKGKLIFAEKEKKEIMNTFLSPKKGYEIGIHWDHACRILTKREISNINTYTQANIDALNQAGFFSTD